MTKSNSNKHWHSGRLIGFCHNLMEKTSKIAFWVNVQWWLLKTKYSTFFFLYVYFDTRLISLPWLRGFLKILAVQAQRINSQILYLKASLNILKLMKDSWFWRGQMGTFFMVGWFYIEWICGTVTFSLMQGLDTYSCSKFERTGTILVHKKRHLYNSGVIWQVR